MLESSLAGTGVEAQKQLHLSCRETQPTTVGDLKHDDGRGSEQGDSIISLCAVVKLKLSESRKLAIFREIDNLATRRGRD